MANTALVIFMGLTGVLLFAVMVVSSIASNNATKSAQDCQTTCHSYSMYSALIAGLAVVALIISGIIYWRTESPSPTSE